MTLLQVSGCDATICNREPNCIIVPNTLEISGAEVNNEANN
jgi:hypothetical protein